MKFNSKYAYVFSALLVLAIVVSSASAAGDLVKNDFGNENFAIDVPSGSNFNEGATTNLDLGGINMNMAVYENGGDNSNDVSAIMYLKDSSNKNIIDEAINDLKKEGVIVEETDKYFVVETKNSNNWDFFNFDIGNDLNSLFGFVDGIFSSESNIDVSENGSDVHISSADGLNIGDNENNTVSFSDKGLQVSSGNGDGVSISDEGIKFSGSASEGDANDTNGEVNVSMDGHMLSSIGNDDYALCIKNPSNDQMIVISGNNLDLLKSMAESASFTEK